MPKLPIIKDKQLIKVLKKIGFFEHRETSSSHLVLKHHDGRMTIVARHSRKDIPRGTLNGILKDINISPQELTDLLK